MRIDEPSSMTETMQYSILFLECIKQKLHYGVGVGSSQDVKPWSCESMSH